jgi:hypothetical protein
MGEKKESGLWGKMVWNSDDLKCTSHEEFQLDD